MEQELLKDIREKIKKSLNKLNDECVDKFNRIYGSVENIGFDDLKRVSLLIENTLKKPECLRK